MDEEPTQQLTNFEQRVLAEFAALRREVSDINQRLTKLEETVERRLYDTRPMWEAALVQLREVKDEIGKLVAGIRELNRDIFDTRTRVAQLEERQRPPAA